MTRNCSGLARVAAHALCAVTLRSRVAGVAALLLFLGAALVAGCSHGNRLTKVVRTNKTSVIGTLVAMRPDMVVLKTPAGVTVEIPRTEISSIETPTLSEIAALQGAGSGRTAANGGGTNPAGGADNPAGGGPGSGQRADAGGASSGSGAAGAGGTGPGGVPGGAGSAGDATGQRAGDGGSTPGQSGDPGTTASNRLPSSGGSPGGGGAGSGGSGAGGSGAPGGAGASGTSANRDPAGGGASGAGASGGASGAASNRTPSGGFGSPGTGGTGSGPAGSGGASGSSGTSGRSITLPAYAEMHVALESDLGSDTSRAEEDVYATLTQPVTIGGVTRVPAGARLRGTITEAVPGANANGRGRLAFRFHTLIVGSTSVPIETALVRKIAGRLSKEDAKKIGIGAAIGGTMGKILTKTKKGLGIGAAAGAGGTAVALSSRPDIHLESGTTLRIKLQKRVAVPAS